MVKLKKGSAAAKAWGRKMKRLRAARKPKSKRLSTPKRRKSIKYERIKRTMVKKKRRKSYKKSASVWGINTGKAAAAGVYGAGRARMSALLAPYTSKLPAGAVSDEVGMVIALQLMKKMVFKKAGLMRDAATAGQTIEFARIGEALASGQINLGALSAQPQASGNLF